MRGPRLAALGVAMALLGGCGGGEAVAEAPAPTKAKKPKAAAPQPRAPVAEPEPPPPPPMPKTLASLDEAKAKAAELHSERRETYLCGCRYSKSGRVSPASCGYRVRADERKAKYVGFGHVVPPHDFGAHRACWTQPLCTAEDGSKFRGIECCQQVDAQFATMRADLHNLVPMVGEVAGDRSNYAVGEVEGEPRLYGSCDLEIDPDAEMVEPPPEARGDVARVYLYMMQTYPDALKLSESQLTLLKTWSAEDPPDEWEQQYARAVTQLQGIAPSWLAAPPEAPADAAMANGEAAGDAVGSPDAVAAGDSAEGATPSVDPQTGVKGEPVTGEPATGEPATGAPAKGEPAKGEPAKGEPAKGEPAKGAPAKGEPAKGEPATGAAAKGEPAKKGKPATAKGAPPKGAAAEAPAKDAVADADKAAG